jgi:hypothetical protein
MGKRSTLNKAGIRQLADDLVANKKMYDQDDFGSREECGTVCCLAGFCYRHEIGARKFTLWAKDEDHKNDDCIKSGLKQLGLPVIKSDYSWIEVESPQVFGMINIWPDDLEDEYYENGPRGRVIVALKALQRLREDGTIDPDPKKVHTKLPQLKALLATKPGGRRD